MSPSLSFIGEHPATLDGEGRIQLPSGLRDDLNPSQSRFALMANIEPDGSICLRTYDEWEAYVLNLQGSPQESPRSRRALQFLAAHSGAAKCDKSGRVRIPDALLLQVGLDRSFDGRRDVVIVGNFDDIRVWSPDAWAEFRDTTRTEYGSGIDDLLGHKRLGPEGIVDRDTA